MTWKVRPYPPVLAVTRARPPIVSAVSGKHASGEPTRVTFSDFAYAAFYGLVPFLLILGAGGPAWAAILVAVASAGIGFWRQV